MAQRRMFSLRITNSDLFRGMPLSAQALYFHLAMNADDDGFVDSALGIKRAIGAADDDLRMLIAKRFVIPFDSGVCVIRQWHVHNYIQKDRYQPTLYQAEKAMLAESRTEKRAYELATASPEALPGEGPKNPINAGVNGFVRGMDTKCIQNVDTGKVRLGEVRSGKREVIPQSDYRDDDEEPLEARAREAARQAWTDGFGKSPTPAALEHILRAWRISGVDAELLTAAVEMAAMRDPASPADYVACLMADWTKHRVMSRAQLDEYLCALDAARGKLDEKGVWGYNADARQLAAEGTDADGGEARE